MKNIILCLLIASTCCYQCDRNKNDCEENLEFELPFQLYGLKDTLLIGDTFSIKMEVPDRLIERNQNKEYNFGEKDFRIFYYMAKIDTTPFDIRSNVLFDWEPVQGKMEWVVDLYNITPYYLGNIYHHEALFIPKSKGLYLFWAKCFLIGRLVPVGHPCESSSVKLYPRIKNETDVNFEFLQYSEEPGQHNVSRQKFDDYASFCFYVR